MQQMAILVNYEHTPSYIQALHLEAQHVHLTDTLLAINGGISVCSPGVHLMSPAAMSSTKVITVIMEHPKRYTHFLAIIQY